MFSKHFRLTDPHDDLASAFKLVEKPLLSPPSVGAYEDGLINVVDAASSRSFLQSWRWLLGPNCIALMTTGFGDVFFWEASKGVCFLDVQHGEQESLGEDLDWFLSEFLLLPDIGDSVLRTLRFRQVVKRNGPLSFHQAFILEPWLMLGGAGQGRELPLWEM